MNSGTISPGGPSLSHRQGQEARWGALTANAFGLRKRTTNLWGNMLSDIGIENLSALIVRFSFLFEGHHAHGRMFRI